MDSVTIIIDNDVAHLVFLDNDNNDFSTIQQGLLYNNGLTINIVYCRKLLEEYCTNETIRRIVTRLDQAGRALAQDENHIERETGIITRSHLCQSNDFHILALARVSKVRILCSHDQKLHSDFTNKNILDNPRGKVYQNQKHDRILKKYASK